MIIVMMLLDVHFIKKNLVSRVLSLEYYFVQNKFSMSLYKPTDWILYSWYAKLQENGH